MNWVGGARSRVKQQNERKVQKEFFERTRLMKKIKKARPTSPGEGRMRATISRDLLFLNTLNHVHGRGTVYSVDVCKFRSPHSIDLGKHKQEPSRKPTVVDLSAAGRNVRRPDRNLELPMSPIGKPSTLNFLDTSTVSSLNLSHYNNQPKVSTQKVPHQTVLRGFAPAHQPQFDPERNQRPVLERHQTLTSSLMNAPVMPESAIPAHKKPHHHSKGNNTSSRDRHYQWNGACDLTNNGTKGKQLAGFVGKTNRKRSMWERSYDHETPFNFESRGTKRPRIQHVPHSKGSLLDFHRQQGVDGIRRLEKEEPKCLSPRSKKLYNQEGLWKREPAIAPKYPAEESASVSCMEAALPTQQASELKFVQQAPADLGYTNRKPPFGASRHTSVAESFLEEPLHRPTTRNSEPPKSVSTVFNESILGPISHHKKSKHAHLKSTEEGTSSSQKPQDHGKPKTLSTFEKMILYIEQGRPLAAKSTQCGMEKGEIGKVPKGTGDAVYSASGAQHAEWRKFTMEEPLAELPVVEKETTQKKRQPLKLHSEPCDTTQGKGKAKNPAEDKMRKPLLGISDFRSKKNVSVMEELFCLEEELTSSLESEDSLAASQDVPLTQAYLTFPEEPIQRVPQARPSHKTTALEEAAGSSQEDSEKTFAEVPLCSHPEELEARNGKTRELGVQNLPDHDGCWVDGDEGQAFRNTRGTQTDDPPVKLLKEASSECDIWSADTVRLESQVQFSLPTKQASAQTSPIPFQVDCTVQTNPVSFQVDCAVQTAVDVLHSTANQIPDIQHSVSGGQSPPQDQEGEQRALGGGTAVNSIPEGDREYLSMRIQELEGEVSWLRKQLLTTQNTVLWQSLMMKLHQMEV